jgi:plasmid stabilization system protein ParE
VASRDAEADLSEAIDWYEEQRPGLGERLLESVEQVRARIEANPFQFPAVYRDARRGLLRDFPYALIFRVSDTEARILACFHTSRDPRRWQTRVRRDR